MSYQNPPQANIISPSCLIEEMRRRNPDLEEATLYKYYGRISRVVESLIALTPIEDIEAAMELTGFKEKGLTSVRMLKAIIDERREW